ncbi:MAG: sulfatase [Rikenellaceae bacterium]
MMNNMKWVLPPVAALSVTTISGAQRPNIVWYMIEDTSPHYMALYNDGRGGQTPNLDSITDQSIIYNNAFSNAPVSSAARTTLITGCYAPSFAGSFHRRIEQMPMPEGLGMFPSYLREEGYYTCNASKTDYNVDLDNGAWNLIDGELGDWRKRESEDQPFFYVRTNTTTHESKLLFGEETFRTKPTQSDPDEVLLHDYLPDTELMRYTYATFYDRIKEADEEFGQMVDMLREDGVLDNTIIFFFGDNGGSLPGSKGYTDNIGFRVPLVVYVPEALRESLAIERVGERVDDLVSFIDFGATALNLAGVTGSKRSDGVPFLGKKSKHGVESVVCYGDRFDDLYSFNRTLYRGSYRYARNYQPYQTQSLYSYYRYHSLALQQWREMYEQGELTERQSSFFRAFGAEELYDLEADPNEDCNLATDPAYASVLRSMRSELSKYVVAHHDLGFYPEVIVYEQGAENPDRYGAAHVKDIKNYCAIADLQLLPFGLAESKLIKALGSDDDVAKWWALTSASWFGLDAAKSSELVAAAKELTESGERSFVRSRAELFLSVCGMDGVTSSDVDDILNGSKRLAETLLVLNDFAYMSECGYMPDMEYTYKSKDTNVKQRIKYLNR